MLRSTRSEVRDAASVVRPNAFDSLTFRSSAYRRVCEQTTRFARAGRAPILIEGESGTGKTQLARHLHRLSARATSPFEYVVLSAVDDSLAGSELFGHVTGAFTDARSSRAGHFVTAAGGTLFLDEIAKASPSVQQKLLHAVEYGEIRPIGSDRDIRIDVRIVAASNTSLEQLALQGRFLPDLYARLSAFRIELPPLRRRRADIPALAAYFTETRAGEVGYEMAPSIHPDLMAALQRAPWPNNIRQLDSTLYRILVDADGSRELRLEHCVDDLEYLRFSTGAPATAEPLTAETAGAAIARAGGSITGAARLLGVDRTTVHRALKRTPADESTRFLGSDEAIEPPRKQTITEDLPIAPASTAPGSAAH